MVHNLEEELIIDCSVDDAHKVGLPGLHHKSVGIYQTNEIKSSFHLPL